MFGRMIFIIGISVIVGAATGTLLMSLCIAAKKSDNKIEEILHIKSK